MLTMAELLANTAVPGRLDWIGLRPARREPVISVEQVEAVAGRGLRGDRSASRAGSRRQVTLMQAEHLAVIESCLGGQRAVTAELLRRNLVVSRINVAALRTSVFRIGDVLLEGTGHCHPCSRMGEALGHGGYNAVRGMGGITARILEGGTLLIGAPVTLVQAGKGER